MLMGERDRVLYSYGEHVYEVPRIVAVKTTTDRVCVCMSLVCKSGDTFGASRFSPSVVFNRQDVPALF